MNDAVRAQLLVLKIIVGSMALGIVAFAVVAVVAIGDQAKASDPTLPAVLFAILASSPLIAIPVYVFLRAAMVRRLRDKIVHDSESDSTGQLLGVYSTLTIIRSAMAEFVGLFACVTHLLTQNFLVMGVSAAAVVVLLSGLPTMDKFRRMATDVLGLDGLARLGR